MLRVDLPELLESGVTKDNGEQIKEGLEVVKLMVNRIRNMVLDILFYAKDRELKKERVNVNSFAKDVSMTVESKMREQQIEFVLDLLFRRWEISRLTPGLSVQP